MSRPPKEQDLYPDKTMLYIPQLLDIFCMVVISGKLYESDSSNVSERTIRLKNSVAQDIVYAVSNGTIKTHVLFPTVVKSLCNNTEVIRIINQYGHGISYDKVEKIETEYALKVIDEQKQSRVIIPEGVTAKGAVIKYRGEGGWTVNENSCEKFRPPVISASTI